MELYGKDNGVKLYDIMMRISRKDFCVATAWDERQFSVALSCTCSGTVFKISEDNESIIAPDGTIINVARASYGDIQRYLPKVPKVGLETPNKHCGLDDRVGQDE